MAYLGNQPVVGDSANTFKTLDDIASFTVTFDATSSDVVSIANDTLTFNNHRFVTAQKVTYNDGGGTAIGGLADGSYFIIKEDQNTIKLASSAANAASGTAINLTSGAAGGSHTLKIAFDGVNTKFKATHSNGTKANISRAAQLSLSINGVIQQPQDTTSPTVGYGIEADSTIVFSTAPESSDVIFGSFIGEVAASFDITDNTVDEFTADGSTTAFTLSKELPSNNDALVTLDGVVQYPNTQSNTRAYSTTDNTITFTSAPAAGVIIQVRHIGFAGASSNEVTAFYGRTGNVQLKNTDNVAVNNLTAAGTVTVAGNLDVTGDITYDETVSRNLNVTGIATVASGIVSTGDFKVGTATTLSQDNIFTTGIITATSFVGSGANLTGVASTENIRTNTNATFLQNVSVVGTSTVTGNIVPSSDSATDIGTNSVRFQNAYVDNYYGSGANLTNLPVTASDIDNLINNIAMLGFKVATNGSLAKFNLVDQVVDDYNSSAGIDASASTNETLTSGYYVGNVAGGSASGGTETTVGSYKVHTFLSSGTFTIPTGYSATVDALIVAGGGGGGGGRNGGGGGAGGMLQLTSQSLTAGAKTVTVGAGGAGGPWNNSTSGGTYEQGTQGSNSSITGLTVAIGGGGGANNGKYNSDDGGNGGSGGGGGNNGSSANGTGTSGQGNDGGGKGGSGGASGGGGAGEAGGTDGTRAGGDGLQNNWRTGSNVYYAGGGSGGEDSCRSDVSGGEGGGGNGKGCGSSGQAGTANTGGGGGGAGEGTDGVGGAGGSGIVVIRYNSSTGLSGPGDLTLQSTDSTALSVPTSADLVMLIEDGVGTATLNTDIKAFISRDSGANFTQGTLVEEGTWGATTKRTVAFHNLDISGQPSGTDICYKITTHNQGSTKETRIHATSYGWK